MIEQIDQLREIAIQIDEVFAVTDFLMARHFKYHTQSTADMLNTFTLTGDLIRLVHDIVWRQIGSLADTIEALLSMEREASESNAA